MNERLRAAMLQADVTFEELARACGVDEKTAERWVTSGRPPHERNRRAAAKILGVKADFLWPDARSKALTGLDDLQSSLIRTYADRSSVPRDVWLQLVSSATEAIDVLVYSGTFLAQTNPRLPAMLADRAGAGVEVRLCFGDPDGSAVALRDEEEGIGGTLGPKIRASLSYFAHLTDVAGCEVRLHNCTVYASLFRYDDQALVNPHLWGNPASANPILHVRRVGDCLFEQYGASFERVWDRAKPWTPSP
jgi:transcriptional regulator with XRE-family HTH domain